MNSSRVKERKVNLLDDDDIIQWAVIDNHGIMIEMMVIMMPMLISKYFYKVIVMMKLLTLYIIKEM